MTTTMIPTRIASATGTLAGSDQIAIEVENAPDISATTLTELTVEIQELITRVASIQTGNGTSLTRRQADVLRQLNAMSVEVPVDGNFIYYVFSGDSSGATLDDYTPLNGNVPFTDDGSDANFAAIVLVPTFVNLVEGQEFSYTDSSGNQMFAQAEVGDELLFGLREYTVTNSSGVRNLSYSLNGTYSTFTLTGAVDSFQVRVSNLSQGVRDLINSAMGGSLSADDTAKLGGLELANGALSGAVSSFKIEEDNLSQAVLDLIANSGSGAATGGDGLTPEQASIISQFTVTRTEAVDFSPEFLFAILDSEDADAPSELSSYSRNVNSPQLESPWGLLELQSGDRTYVVLTGRDVILPTGREFISPEEGQIPERVVAATFLGVMFNRNAYRVTVPQSPANFVEALQYFPNIGTVTLAGANDSFKVRIANLSQEVIDRIDAGASLSLENIIKLAGLRISNGELSGADESFKIFERNLSAEVVDAIESENLSADNTNKLAGLELTGGELSGAISTFKIEGDNLSDEVLDLLRPAVNPNPDPQFQPEVLRSLASHLVADQSSTTEYARTARFGVQTRSISPYIRPQVLYLWDINRRTLTGRANELPATLTSLGSTAENDVSDVTITGVGSNQYFFYGNDTFNNPQRNSRFTGARSFISNTRATIANNFSGTETDPSAWNSRVINQRQGLLVYLEFDRNVDAPANTDNAFINHGGNNHQMLGLSDSLGLYLAESNEDGATHTRTRNEGLVVQNGHWHPDNFDGVNGNAEGLVPNNFTGSLTFTARIQFDDNGNDEGTRPLTLTINDLATSQNFETHEFNFGARFPSISLMISYDAPTRQIRFRPTGSIPNPAYSYNLSIDHPVTTTWRSSTTYGERALHSNRAHDEHGIDNPALLDANVRGRLNRVLFLVRPRFADDVTDDNSIEIGIEAIYNGYYQNDRGNRVLPTHRPSSDFNWTRLTVGEGITNVTRLMISSVTLPENSTFDDLPITFLAGIYESNASYLSLLRGPNFSTDRFVLDANLMVTEDHGFQIGETVIEVVEGEIELLSTENTQKLGGLELDNGQLSGAASTFHIDEDNLGPTAIAFIEGQGVSTSDSDKLASLSVINDDAVFSRDIVSGAGQNIRQNFPIQVFYAAGDTALTRRSNGNNFSIVFADSIPQTDLLQITLTATDSDGNVVATQSLTGSYDPEGGDISQRFSNLSSPTFLRESDVETNTDGGSFPFTTQITRFDTLYVVIEGQSPRIDVRLGDGSTGNPIPSGQRITVDAVYAMNVNPLSQTNTEKLASFDIVDDNIELQRDILAPVDNDFIKRVRIPAANVANSSSIDPSQLFAGNVFLPVSGTISSGVPSNTTIRFNFRVEDAGTVIVSRDVTATFIRPSSSSTNVNAVLSDFSIDNFRLSSSDGAFVNPISLTPALGQLEISIGINDDLTIDFDISLTGNSGVSRPDSHLAFVNVSYDVPIPVEANQQRLRGLELTDDVLTGASSTFKIDADNLGTFPIESYTLSNDVTLSLHDTTSAGASAGWGAYTDLINIAISDTGTHHYDRTGRTKLQARFESYLITTSQSLEIRNFAQVRVRHRRNNADVQIWASSIVPLFSHVPTDVNHPSNVIIVPLEAIFDLQTDDDLLFQARVWTAPPENNTAPIFRASEQQILLTPF